MSQQQQSTGTIKFFNSQKGFGFITPDAGGGKELFVHTSNVVGNAQLREGQKVRYVERPGRKGPEATEVAPA